MNTRNLLLVVFTTFLCAFSLSAQPYTITDYQVAVEIKSDGHVHVNEVITVDFREERRGIFRDIPTTYKGAHSSSGEAIQIENINVKNDPFLVMSESGRVRIRIGSPNITLTGKKVYDISYDVLGALEQFDGYAEFSWNIIGDRWDTSIDNVTAEIRLPYPIVESDSDILLFKGNSALSWKDANGQLSDSSLKLKFPERLKKNRGISLALRFRDHDFPKQEVPAAVISDRFFVNKAACHFDVKENGSVLVTEEYDVILKNQYVFIDRILSSRALESDQHGTIYPHPDFVVGSWNGKEISLKGIRDFDGYHYGATVSGGKGKFKLEYITHGTVIEENGAITLHFDGGTFTGNVAIDTISYHLGLIGGAGLAETPELKGYELIDQKDATYVYERKSHLSGAVSPKFILKGMDPKNFDYPKETRYGGRLMDRLKLKIRRTPGNHVMVREEVEYTNAYSREKNIFSIGNEINRSKFQYKAQGFNVLNRKSDLHVNVLRQHPDYMLRSNADLRAAATGTSESGWFWVDYEVTPNYDDGMLIIPYYFMSTAPIDRLVVEVEDESRSKLVDLQESDLFDHNTDQEFSLFEHNGYRFIAVKVPDGLISELTPMQKLYEFIKANAFLCFALLVCIVLYVLWYFFGRDIKYKGEISSEPPAYMTPAEAGYLWDGRLHGRDLISLIYHWGARGFLLIEEDKDGGKTDFILEKVKDLPDTALEYERILFDALFDPPETRVRVSSLKNKFYKTMSKARKSLKQAFEKKHMYKPYTRGIGIFCVVLGIIVFIIGITATTISFFNSDFTYALPIVIIGIALIIFGYLLPKKTALGSRYFIGMRAFSEFIDQAKPEELEKLYKEDSRYFQNTLAYAIVLGKAKKWAERFEGLVQAPPTYYRGHRYDTFSTLIFADMVTSGMHRMESDLYSQPVSSSGSYSGSRSSSFGGGFSGGGGFGGGGGSSW